MSTVAAVLAIVARVAVAAPAVSLVPCALSHPAGVRVWARCGSVTVAEDAAAPTARTVAIGFAVIPATGADAPREPVALLAGGPGQAATRDFLPLLPALAGLRARHDLVLVDIRGTGRSTPLFCEDTRPLAERIAAPDDAAVVARCAKDLAIDPRFLTTKDAARDVDAVRVALGVERWNVLGVSYGTRLAVVYDALFPGRARTLVLDGVAPLDRALGDDVPADMTASLRALGDENVIALRELKASLRAAPRKVQLRHPTTGAPLEVPVGPEVVNGGVRMLLYADETRAVLPELLRAARRGDLAPLVALAVLAGEQLQAAIHGPVNASILCAEDVPFFTDAVVPADAVLDDERPTMRAACERWPHAAPTRWVFSGTTTPTLIVSGEHDPITPPRHAERVLPLFQSARHVVAPGLGHNVMGRECLADVIAAFIDAGDVGALDTSCASTMAPMPPFIDAQGPAP